MADALTHLARALVALAGDGAAVADAGSRGWASATFVGERHRLALVLPRAAADALDRDLAEHEFCLPGHLVADIAIVRRDERDGIATLAIEALTIEEH